MIATAVVKATAMNKNHDWFLGNLARCTGSIDIYEEAILATDITIFYLRTLRTWLTFAIVFRTPPEKLNLMPEIAEDSVKGVSSCRLVRCCIKALGASGIEYELVYDDRSIDFDTLARHRSSIMTGMMRAFADAGIEFAYPTQVAFTAAPDGSYVMPFPEVQQVVRVDEGPGDQA